jgi:hypothetical protein
MLGKRDRKNGPRLIRARRQDAELGRLCGAIEFESRSFAHPICTMRVIVCVVASLLG